MSIEDRSTIVFATGVGRIKEEKPKAERPQGDGVVRIQLKRLGGGKMASVVSGVPLDEGELKDVARVLKQKCGVGGSVKDFNIEIQGDKRNVLKAELEKKGYIVKLSGGKFSYRAVFFENLIIFYVGFRNEIYEEYF